MTEPPVPKAPPRAAGKHVGLATVTRCPLEDCFGHERGCMGEVLLGRPCTNATRETIDHAAFVERYGRCPVACPKPLRRWIPPAKDPERKTRDQFRRAGVTTKPAIEEPAVEIGPAALELKPLDLEPY